MYLDVDVARYSGYSTSVILFRKQSICSHTYVILMNKLVHADVFSFIADQCETALSMTVFFHKVIHVCCLRSAECITWVYLLID